MEAEKCGGNGEEKAVGPVKHSAVAGNKIAEILDAYPALYKGFSQISYLSQRGADKAGDYAHRKGEAREKLQIIEQQARED